MDVRNAQQPVIICWYL